MADTIDGLGVLRKLPIEIREAIYEETLEDNYPEVVEVHSPCELRSMLVLVSAELHAEVTAVIKRQKDHHCSHENFYCDLTHLHAPAAPRFNTADLASTDGKQHNLGRAEILDIYNVPKAKWEDSTRGGQFSFRALSRRLGYFDEYIGADYVKGSQDLQESVETWRDECKREGEQQYLDNKAMHLAKLIGLFESDQEADESHSRSTSGEAEND